jgi:hypothetical protein
MIIKCIVCGKEKNIRPSQILKGAGKFCSRKCKGAWQSKNLCGNKNPCWRGGDKLKRCPLCGKEYICSRSVESTRIFCSRSCLAKHRSLHLSGENSHNYKSHTKKCVICGIKIIVKKSAAARGYGKCCSNKCRAKLVGLQFSGSKHRNWKGGVTPFNLTIRNSNRNNDWRKKVFQRDNFTCVKCGARGGEIRAHHIKSFKSIISNLKYKYPDYDAYKMLELDSELWDVDNGITVCDKCHKGIHKEKSNGNK